MKQKYSFFAFAALALLVCGILTGCYKNNENEIEANIDYDEDTVLSENNSANENDVDLNSETDTTNRKKNLKEKLEEIVENIKKEDINDLTLTLYYTSRTCKTRFPWDKEDLIIDTECNPEFLGKVNGKVIVTGEELEEHIEGFYGLSEANIKPDLFGYMNARIYSVLESKKNGVLLEIIDDYYINGIYVKPNIYLYNIVVVYMPDDQISNYWWEDITNFNEALKRYRGM